MPKLRLDGVSYDAIEDPSAPAFLQEPSDPPADRSTLCLIQLTGVTREVWIERLGQMDLEVLQYVPERTLIAHGSPAALEQARALPFVVRAVGFPPWLKLSPALREITDRAPPSGREKPGPLDVIIQLFDVQDLKAFRKMLAAAGGKETWVSRPGNRLHIRALVPSDLLAPVARWPSVFRIERFPQIVLNGERESVIASGAFPPADVCVAPGYDAWLASKGTRAEGVVVQVMDDGIDQGDASGVAGTAHPDILGAIAGVDNATSDPGADSRAGHGSLNAGLIAGRGATGWRDANGFLLGQGIAPGAMIFGTKIFNNFGRFETGPRSFADLVSKAAQRGASISSNSWGASVFGEYDVLAAEFDFLTRDAHQDPGSQPMTFFFAAGNQGDDVPGGGLSIGSPATAKNVISVGASESCDADGIDGCGVAPSGADSIQDVAQFSSRGPQADGRLGPLVVAPGTHVSGPASTALGYDGTGLCDPFWPPGQVLYARGSGTSHACPVVAAATALFQHAHVSRTGEAPSAALIRAALAATARDLAGGSDGLGGELESVPNDIQGWGRLSMAELVPDRGTNARTLYFDQKTLLQDSGDTWDLSIFPLDASKPVKIALAWSDAPAVPGADPVLVNDLDLEVESGGALFRGNVFQQGFSVPNGEPDRLNNLECVFLAHPGPVIRIRVAAAAISGDGAPAGDGTDQDFALVVEGGTLQSSRGVASFRRSTFACNAIVGLQVSDLDLKGKPTAQLLVESSTAPQPLLATLTEVNPGSGVFDGSIQLGKDPGQLQVQDGAVLTARYLDTDDGTGNPSESTTTATVDCLAPVITAVDVTELTESSAVVTWSTSEESTGKVLSGVDCGVLSSETLAPRRSSAQSVFLSGLIPGTRQFFTVSAQDLVGNTSVDAHGGTCYSFSTSSLVCGFGDDVEPQPENGWAHAADQGPDDWAPEDFRGARSATHAWHSAGFDGFKDAALAAPPIDIEVGDHFSFWHSFQLEKGYDGAVLEISTNGGASWQDLGPYILRGGYSEAVSGSPLGDRLAWTGQRPEAMTQVEVDLSTWAGSARILRFRLATDASFSDGFGWYLDDFAVCRALNKRGAAALDREMYRCDDSAHVRVDDFDLVGLGTTEVLVSSTSHPEPVTLVLRETQPANGVFAADLVLDALQGGIGAADGDEILVQYSDADDGSGSGPTVVTARARIDCVAPVISGVRLVEMLDDEATLRWETNEPAITEVSAGATCGSADVREILSMGGVSHVAKLTGLSPGTEYRYQITARDAAGNVSIDDAGGTCRLFKPSTVCSYRQDFDEVETGWTHSSTLGKDAWRIDSPAFARSPPNTWFLPGGDDFSDVSLLSPVLYIVPGSFLAFWHTYDFESTFDGAVVEISLNGGATWVDLGPYIRRGGYTSVLVPPNPLAGRKAWSGGGIGPMTRVVIDLSSWPGSFAQFRFRAVSDGSVGGSGWYVDRVELCQGVRQEARLDLDRPAYGCGGRAGVRVLDTDRIGQDNVEVEMSSTSEPLPQTLILRETSPGSGIFEGGVDLSPDAPGAALLVKEGDAVRALYRDVEEGQPAPREVIAIAPVDCRAPIIAGVSVETTWVDGAVFSWTTDEDAFGQVELGTSCAALTIRGSNGTPTKTHRIRMSGLEPGAVHSFRIKATDLAGNTAMDDANGACRTFQTRILYCALAESFEPIARPGWNGGGKWQLVETPLARSSTHAWSIAGEGKRMEASLTLPQLRTGPGQVLELWHTYQLANGITGGVLEASMDGGMTWIDLGSAITEGGYAAYLLPGGVLEGRRAWTGGELGSMTRVRVSLDSLGEGVALIRLRWATQGIGDEGTWIVDDVSVCHAVAGTGKVGFEDLAYACSSVATILLADADLVGKGKQAVEVTAPRQPIPLLVDLDEAAPGFFRGTCVLAPLEAPGAVVAGDGEQIQVTYRDSRNDAGVESIASGSADIDCTAPRISFVRFGAGSHSSVEILWSTDEPTRGRVAFGSTCEALNQSAAGGSAQTSHRAQLAGLTPGVQTFFRVEAVDLAGNKTASPSCLELMIEKSCGFDDSLEPPDDGWTHASVLGPDDWELVVFEKSRSGAHSFHGSNTGVPKDASLSTPPIDILPGTVFSFSHTFELEDGFDGAVIEISIDGGTTWRDLGPSIFEGGYDGTISAPSGALAGWTGGLIRDMTEVRVALDRFEGPARIIRFRILCDDSVGTPGWFIDDVSVCAFRPATGAPSFARGNCNADSTINLSDAIFLLNHLFIGGRVPTCRRACDTDHNSIVNLTDAVFLLDYLFKGGRPLDPPLACEPDFEGSELECVTPACLGG